MPALKTAQKKVTDVFATAENIQLRRQIFAERRAFEASMGGPFAGTGSGNAEDVTTALSHWADDDRPTVYDRPGDEAFLRGSGDTDAAEVEQRLASHHIHNHYMLQPQADFAQLGKMAVPEDTPLDLSNPDARIATLDNLAQNTPKNEKAENTCAAASLVGAAILAGGESGTEGLVTLMDAMVKNAPEGERDLMLQQQEAMRLKMASGEALTVRDMHQLQIDLYSQLVTAQKRAKEAEGKAGRGDKLEQAGRDSGIEPGTVESFIAGSDDLGKMMKDNDLAVSFIDNQGGKDTFTHAVLKIGRGEGQDAAIYDPYLRDEGQIITSAEETADYRRAQKSQVG